LQNPEPIKEQLELLIKLFKPLPINEFLPIFVLLQPPTIEEKQFVALFWKPPPMNE
jgi:hypothetical protein